MMEFINSLFLNNWVFGIFLVLSILKIGLSFFVFRTVFFVEKEKNKDFKNNKEKKVFSSYELSNPMIKRLRSKDNRYFLFIAEKDQDIIKIRNDFKNCLVNYVENHKVHILALYERDTEKPVACISVFYNFSVDAIRGVKNQEVSEEIKGIVLNSLAFY